MRIRPRFAQFLLRGPNGMVNRGNIFKILFFPHFDIDESLGVILHNLGQFMQRSSRVRWTIASSCKALKVPSPVELWSKKMR